jgi:hypothetical protein
MGDGFNSFFFAQRIGKLDRRLLDGETNRRGRMLFTTPMTSCASHHLYPDALHIRSHFMK